MSIIGQVISMTVSRIVSTIAVKKIDAKSSQPKGGLIKQDKRVQNAETEYYREKTKREQELLSIQTDLANMREIEIKAGMEIASAQAEREENALKLKEREIQLMQNDLEERHNLSYLYLDLIREQEKKDIELKLTEIQAKWDKENWSGILSREETEKILKDGQKKHRLLMVVSPPEISKDCPESFINNLEMDIRGDLKEFMEQYYPISNELCPVEFYGKFFKCSISDIEIRQLETILSPVPTAVIYSDITDEKMRFHIGFWGLENPISLTESWNWEDEKKKLEEQGLTEKEILKEIRKAIVKIHEVAAAFLADLYYLNINPYHEPRVFQIIDELLPESVQIHIDSLKEIQQKILELHQKQLQLTVKSEREDNMNFKETKIEAKAIINNLREVSEKSVRKVLSDEKGKFQHDLSLIERQLGGEDENFCFTVGVVGVFNTGKSMLLNALLCRDLLSTGILPETAAITTLKYSEQDKAVVHYWKLEEWRSLELYAKSEKEKESKLSKFFKSFKKIEDTFGSKLSEFITPSGRSEEVPLNRLKEYTSANDKKGHAGLVREVEIGTTIDFCRDNIQIVDTPGLNDPNKLREIITVEKFLPRCDMLLFLLPGRQPFSDFDKSFLERQLEKKQLHKLFVIINQIDTFNKGENLEQVIDFVRKNIDEVFESCTDSSVDLSRGIEIFPVSAYQSFLNRTGQNNEAKMTDEESGIPLFEERLRQFLFEGERARGMQKNIQSRLKATVDSQFGQIDEYLKNLNSSVTEIEEAIKKVQAEAKVVRQELKNVQADIKKTLYHFEVQYDAQVKLMDSNIKSLGMNIQEKAYEEAEKFLNSHNFAAALYHVEKWAKNTFTPFLEGNIKKEVDKIVSDAQNHIEYLIRGVLEEFKMAYQRMENSISLNLPSTAVQDYVVLVGSAISGIALGLAGNVAVGTALAHLGGLTGTFLLTTPIGWGIIAVLTVPTLFIGGKIVKNNIRSRLKDELPKQLNRQLNEISNNMTGKFKDAKFPIMEELRNEAEVPAKEIERQLQQKEENLKGLLDKKKSQEINAEKERQSLMQEKSAFEEIMQKIDTMCK